MNRVASLFLITWNNRRCAANTTRLKYHASTLLRAGLLIWIWVFTLLAFLFVKESFNDYVTLSAWTHNIQHSSAAVMIASTFVLSKNTSTILMLA